VPGQKLLVFSLFEESPQIDAADGSNGSIQAAVHVNFLTNLLGQLGRNVKRFGFAIDQNRDLKLRMEINTIGTAAVGAATGAFALDEGTWEHLAEGAEATDESATQFEIRVGWHLF